MKRAAFLFLLTACSSSSPPGDAGNGDAANGVDGAADVAAESAPACKHAGDTCSPSDTCNTWSCKCANITNPEITVGSCTGGTCQSGAEACASLCANAGGVTSSTDDGC
jgi:hypothetical protein